MHSKVSEVLRGRIPILKDNRIRGADVIEAISLGAGAVLIGKLYTFALAVGERKGFIVRWRISSQ